MEHSHVIKVRSNVLHIPLEEIRDEPDPIFSGPTRPEPDRTFEAPTGSDSGPRTGPKSGPDSGQITLKYPITNSNSLKNKIDKCNSIICS